VRQTLSPLVYFDFDGVLCSNIPNVGFFVLLSGTYSDESGIYAAA